MESNRAGYSPTQMPGTGKKGILSKNFGQGREEGSSRWIEGDGGKQKGWHRIEK